MKQTHATFPFAQTTAHLRNTVAQLAQAKTIEAQQLTAISDFVSTAGTAIGEYECMLKCGVEMLQKLEEKDEVEPLIFTKGEACYMPQKLPLHLWQIINFLCINSAAIDQQLLFIANQLLQISIQYEPCLSLNTIKNALITLHNIIAKAFKAKQQSLLESYIYSWMDSILIYHFERKSNLTLSKLCSYFKFSKSEEVLVQETEWIAYLFRLIFEEGSCSSREVSFLELLEKNGNAKSGFYALHMIGNFFQDMIDKRVTTELVRGFECHISDVQQMYASKASCLIELHISKYDLAWACMRFKATLSNYQRIVKLYLQLQLAQFEESKFNDLLRQWREVTDYLQEFFHVLNCILFIGGYNSALQDFIIHPLLESGKELLQFFQISYLLYRNIESTKYAAKVGLMVEMQKEAKKKLLTLVNSQLTPEQVNLKALRLQRILGNGQLVSVLRLLTNLVHINQRSQVPFEEEPKYLHMVLSLTHDSVSQATMKEWAIMFIRNVSEWSHKLREEISAVKVQMKVA